MEQNSTSCAVWLHLWICFFIFFCVLLLSPGFTVVWTRWLYMTYSHVEVAFIMLLPAQLPATIQHFYNLTQCCFYCFYTQLLWTPNARARIFWTVLLFYSSILIDKLFRFLYYTVLNELKHVNFFVRKENEG